MNKSLFVIEQEYKNINELLFESEGEVTPEIQELMVINQQELERKSQGYGYVIKTNDAEITIIDMEIKRLQSLKKSREKNNERLEDCIKNAMNLYGIEKIDTPTLKISLRKSESVEIEDEGKLADEYVTVKVNRQPDKTKIKEAIKQGKEVSGASLKVNKNLAIK